MTMKTEGEKKTEKKQQQQWQLCRKQLWYYISDQSVWVKFLGML